MGMKFTALALLLSVTFVGAQQEAVPEEAGAPEEADVPEEEEDDGHPYIKNRPRFDWSNKEFYEKQLKLQFGVPTVFCAGKGKTHVIKEIKKEPHVTLVHHPNCINHIHMEAYNWRSNQAKEYSLDDLTIRGSKEKVEPYFYFHSKKVLACVPKDTEFNENEHPTITVMPEVEVD